MAALPLALLYWTLYLLLFSETPQVFYVSEFGWVASVIFLYILQYALSSAEERGFPCRKALIALLIGVPLCVFYCTFGDILSNLLWCGMMIVVSYHAIRGLAYARTQTGAARDMQYFHIGVLVLCGGGICPLDFRLLLAGRFHFQPLLLV